MKTAVIVEFELQEIKNLLFEAAKKKGKFTASNSNVKFLYDEIKTVTGAQVRFGANVEPVEPLGPPELPEADWLLVAAIGCGLASLLQPGKKIHWQRSPDGPLLCATIVEDLGDCFRVTGEDGDATVHGEQIHSVWRHMREKA